MNEGMDVMGIGAEQIAVICAAAVNCIYDIRKREILFVPTVLFAGAGIIFGLTGGRGIIYILTGILPGALLAALSVASRGSVGFGDAVMTAAVGIWSGAVTAFLALTAALGIQAFTSVIYRAAGGRKNELPFIPALLAGYIVCLAVM